MNVFKIRPNSAMYSVIELFRCESSTPPVLPISYWQLNIKCDRISALQRAEKMCTRAWLGGSVRHMIIYGWTAGRSTTVALIRGGPCTVKPVGFMQCGVLKNNFHNSACMNAAPPLPRYLPNIFPRIGTCARSRKTERTNLSIARPLHARMWLLHVLLHVLRKTACTNLSRSSVT